MPEWSLLTSHTRVLMCIAKDPEIRLRDIARPLHTTERTVSGIIKDLVEGGYVVKTKTGRRNRYQIQAHHPVTEMTERYTTLGELLDLLGSSPARKPGSR